MDIALIAALDEARLIGAGSGMPWHLPADLARFRRLTLGKPVLMGRRTHESIGRALPGRLNLVVSRDTTYRAPGCTVLAEIDTAIEVARNSGAAELMVIGGAQIYAALLARARRLYLTRVHARLAGDTWFPAWAEDEWSLVEREAVPADERNALASTFEIHERRRAAGSTTESAP